MTLTPSSDWVSTSFVVYHEEYRLLEIMESIRSGPSKYRFFDNFDHDVCSE